MKELERKIQESASKKDQYFRLAASYEGIHFWFVGEKEGFKIYRVDTEWVTNNISVLFEHAGHGLVHEFIPMDEIWVGTHHFERCPCKNVRLDRKISRNNFESTVIHEIVEFKIMALGISYDLAHPIALWVEKTVGILKDPYTEEYTDKDN